MVYGVFYRDWAICQEETIQLWLERRIPKGIVRVYDVEYLEKGYIEGFPLPARLIS